MDSLDSVVPEKFFSLGRNGRCLQHRRSIEKDERIKFYYCLEIEPIEKEIWKLTN